MISLKRLSILMFGVIGLGYSPIFVEASEPSVHSKLLTPSPLGRDRVLVLCILEKGEGENLREFYDSVMWNEFSERELTVVEVSQSTVESVFGYNRGDVKGGLKKARHHDFGDRIRKRADCKNNLEFVLIGKDRGVKRRWEGRVPQEQLFQVIDAMPMRRFEMRQKAGEN